MNAFGKIGVIMPEIMDPLDYEMLRGIQKQAAELNYDVIIYTGIFNSQSELQQDYYTDGLENIYSLISKSRLQRMYRNLFSTNIKDDIISSRIEKAKQLLTHTELRVQEIAEQCGYNNENHFMRQFKGKTGVTALQYRKNN